MNIGVGLFLAGASLTLGPWLYIATWDEWDTVKAVLCVILSLAGLPLAVLGAEIIGSR